MDALARPFGVPLLSARFRCAQEDFVVDEVLGFEPDGSGEHLFLRVTKRGANTAFVARELGRWAGVDERGVGYAGMKDRHAVTTQTFSLHLPGRDAPAEWPQHAEYEVIAASRHRRKLPRGALSGNRFEILLRDVHGVRDAIDARVAEIGRVGFANYFGEQRFGRDGANLDAARRLFQGQRLRREQRGIVLSAARSALFNQVLSARIQDASWYTGLDGDIWMLDGSHSVFGPVVPDTVLAERVSRGDIHPTGPLWGAGERRVADRARAVEGAALQAFGDLRDGLAGAGLRQERRALRIRPSDLRVDWPRPDQMRLRFFLPAGSYATALLFALGDVADSAPRGGSVPAATD